MTKEEAKLWSPDLPGDIALAKMDDSDLIVSDLKRDRTAAIERVTSDFGDAQCTHVLRFNCDEFVDASSEKHPSLLISLMVGNLSSATRESGSHGPPLA